MENVWKYVKERVVLVHVCRASKWRISRNVVRTAGEYLGDSREVLGLVHSGAIVVMNLRDKTTLKFALPLQFSNWTFFCRITEQCILGIGSRPATTSTYRIHLMTGTLQPGPPLTLPRTSPGLFSFNQRIYVFGGYDDQIDRLETEILDIEPNTWRVAAAMSHPRDGFTPCLWEMHLYLVDVGYSHRVVERFSVQTEKMEELPWVLPSSLSDNSVAYIYRNQLVLLTCTGHLALLGLDTYDWRIRPLTLMKSSILSNTPPILLDTSLYLVRWDDGGLISLDLLTLTLTE